MKEMAKKEQRVNLINCEEIQIPRDLQNNSSQIRWSIPVKIKYSIKKPQVVNIHQTDSIVRLKQGK
ncbi:MAG: hypothetical protein MUP27_07830 [Desulfobacterales bacterium]|nr:hypothetical protein [Desulfobacterales bacterium]